MRNFWIFGFGGFCILLMVGLVVFTTLFLVHDHSTDCHWRIHNDDACWQDLNEQVSDLQRRVKVLEQK